MAIAARCSLLYWFILNLCLLISSLSAATLDDKIAAFKDAPSQTENAVSDILQTGLKENRSALAFASVKPWLNANPSQSQTLLHRAAQAAEFAGDWTAAASFYRKLFKSESLNGNIAAEAVPACYRLLINHLGDPESAYIFMREEGARLRIYGDANKFDSWFLTKAIERKDLIALSRWMTAIHNTNESLEPLYSESLDTLLSKLETFNHSSEELFAELDKLAAAKKTTPAIKARITWVKEIVPFASNMAEFVGARKEISRNHSLNEPLKAAETLIAAAPYEGSIAVTKGWMHFNAGDSGVFSRFIAPRRAEKAAPLLQALRKLLPTEQARHHPRSQGCRCQGSQDGPIYSHPTGTPCARFREARNFQLPRRTRRPAFRQITYHRRSQSHGSAPRAQSTPRCRTRPRLRQKRTSLRSRYR